VGDFHQRAMAIAALDERLRFLNRGQGWVAKRLGEMIPRVGDGELREALVEMRENHVANIARVNDFLPAAP
jgi:nitronate monooxygenase